MTTFFAEVQNLLMRENSRSGKIFNSDAFKGTLSVPFAENSSTVLCTSASLYKYKVC